MWRHLGDQVVDGYLLIGLMFFIVAVALLSPVWITGFLSFGLMALLYLVTEELLVEAHEKPDTPLISSMFFVGFLALLTLEEIMG